MFAKDSNRSGMDSLMEPLYFYKKQETKDLCSKKHQTMQTVESFHTVELYGGACLLSIPSRFIDISQFRQISDHQEVFADSEKTDQSIIVEIVEYDSQISDQNIAEYHFKDLAEANDALENCTIFHQQLLYPTNTQNSLHFDSSIDTFSKAIIVGTQQVAKYKETAKNIVNVYLFIIRLPQYQSEILISMNDPVLLNPQSSASTNAVATSDASASMSLFQQIVQSFKIVDFELFG